MPTAGNAPLYPLLASLLVGEETQRSLACFLRAAESSTKKNIGAACEVEIEPLIAFNYFLAGLSLWLIGLLAFALRPQDRYFFLAPLFAFLAFELTDYAQRLLVLNLVVPLFLALQISFLMFLKNKRYSTISVMGLCAGLLILTRPEYLYLFPFIFLLVGWHSKSFKKVAMLTLTTVITLSPWLSRNQTEFGNVALIQSDYGGHVATERLALNQMTWQQWLVSFVYWFPDSGDKAASAIFPEHLVSGFDTSHSDTLFVTLQPGSTKSSAFQVLADGIIEDPVKHAAVSIALAWRGIFVGKLWGVVAVIGWLLLLRRETRSGRFELLWVSLIPLYMLFLRSGVSLNVTRYNVPMIGLLSMGWVYISVSLYDRFRGKLT